MSDLLCLVERRFGPSKFLTSFLSAVRGGKRKLDVMEAEGGARRQGSLPVRREGERGREGARERGSERAENAGRDIDSIRSSVMRPTDRACCHGKEAECAAQAVEGLG